MAKGEVSKNTEIKRGRLRSISRNIGVFGLTKSDTSLMQFSSLSGEAPVRELYSPKEVERILSISHAQLYRLLGAGRLTAVKIGRCSYIPRAAIDKFLADLPAAKVRASIKSSKSVAA